MVDRLDVGVDVAADRFTRHQMSAPTWQVTHRGEAHLWIRSRAKSRRSPRRGVLSTLAPTMFALTPEAAYCYPRQQRRYRRVDWPL